MAEFKTGLPAKFFFALPTEENRRFEESSPRTVRICEYAVSVSIQSTKGTEKPAPRRNAPFFSDDTRLFCAHSKD
jgi:hypothetical protein